MASFDSGSILSSMSSDLNNAFITDPMAYLSEQTANDRISNIFKNDPDKILDLLQDWDFVQALIDIYASPMREILTKNEYKISFGNSELVRYEDFINEKIEEIDLQNILLTSLKDTIYRGAFYKNLVYNSKDKKFFLLESVTPWKTVYIERLGKPFGYLRNGIFVDRMDGLFSAYRLHKKKTFTLDSVKDKKIREKLDKELGEEIAKNRQTEILAYVHYVPRSVFWGQASKLFQIYLNEFMSNLLALRDSVRQDLFTVILSPTNKKVVNGAQVAQSIEDAINQSSNLVVQQDPQTLLTQVTYAMFNNARVLPAIENYSNISELKLQDLKNKREQLQGETEDMKKQLITNLGIPEEISSGLGQGNRWEILSRSDKFMTSINALVMLHEDIVKQVVTSMMLKMGRFCRTEDVVFSILNDTPLQSQMSRNKADLFVNSISDSIHSIDGVKALIATGYVDQNKVINEFVSNLQRWNLPFSSAYFTADEILQSMNDPNSPTNQFSGVE